MHEVEFGRRRMAVPIIQGGMGIGVSLERLSGAVAACGGMGVLSAAHAGYRAEDFGARPVEANMRELGSAVARARQIARGVGLIGVNVMVACQDYARYVKTSVEAGADAIISGAGLPLELPSFAEGRDVLLAPIVSSAKAVKLICRSWQTRYNRLPDFVVVEGAEAGGHLGFSANELVGKTARPLADLVRDVVAAVNPFAETVGRKIPVFAAGGVFTGKDIGELMACGADGVQMATRFIATEECDADDGFKQAIIDSREEDIGIVVSPVGMPARAIQSPFVKRVASGVRERIVKCVRCLRGCAPADAPYCITQALVNAAKGRREDGLFFCGANAFRVDRIRKVDELIAELMDELRAFRAAAGCVNPGTNGEALRVGDAS